MSREVRGILRQAVGNALKGATIAGNDVFLARDWPVPITASTGGIILVLALNERKERVRSGQLFYTTTSRIDVLARIARGGPETALRYLDEMTDQIEAAVICSATIRQYTQYAPNVETEIGITSEAQLQIAQGRVSFEFEYPERYQIGGVPLTAITNQSPGEFGSFSAPIPQ